MFGSEGKKILSVLSLRMFCLLTLSKKTNHSHTAVCLTSPSHSHFALSNFSCGWISLTPPCTAPQRCSCPTSAHPPFFVRHSPLLPPPSSSPVFLYSSAPAPLPDCFQSFLREEALDFFCSQCHKQISRLEDLSTRLNFLEMTR